MKKSRQPKITGPDSIIAFDEVMDCCLNIRALAELLSCQEAALHPETIVHAGRLIFAETEKLQKRLEMLAAGAKR